MGCIFILRWDGLVGGDVCDFTFFADPLPQVFEDFWGERLKWEPFGAGEGVVGEDEQVAVDCVRS